MTELGVGGSSLYQRLVLTLGRGLTEGSGRDALSGRLTSLDAKLAERVRADLVNLPSTIGLLHPRVVVPVKFTLRVLRPVTILSAEALAVALLLV